MSFIFCSSQAIIRKAGLNANSTIIASGAAISDFSDYAESLINNQLRYNFSDTYSTLNTDVKRILDDVASSLGAMQLIAYDMSGYTSRAEAQTMLDLQRDTAERGLQLLKDKNRGDFITGA